MAIHLSVTCKRCQMALASRELLPSEAELTPELLARALGAEFAGDYMRFAREHSDCGGDLDMCLVSILPLARA